MRRFHLGVMMWLCSCSAGWAATAEPIGIDRFCVAPEQQAILRWQVEVSMANSRVKAVVRDYANHIVATPPAEVTAQGVMELTLQLPTGFYEIEFPEMEQRFGLMVTPAESGTPDPFFAIDSALSWLVHDRATREGLIRLLARCRISMSRERLNWAQIQPTADTWNWDGSQGYETLRQVYRREGIPVLEMFHGTTAWAGRVGKYPDDLVSTAESWQQIISRFQPTWGAMEVWNEPDISFGDHLPADQYVSLVKTFSYLFQTQQVGVPLVGGVFAHHHRRFLDSTARNGLLDQVSVISFHTYDRAPSMENLIRRYRTWLTDYDHAAFPLWLTECGRPWKRGPERPPCDQDAISALDIVMKGVESKACGVARYFAFVYPYYDERESNFGMMGRDATPLRSMAAYVQLATALAHKRYVGDLTCHDPTVQRARVFADQHEAIAILFTGQPNSTATVHSNIPVQKIQGIDGRVLTPSTDGTVPIPDGLVYLQLDRKELDSHLKTDTPAMKLYSLGNQPPAKPADASPIVIRYQFDPIQVAAKTEGYQVIAESMADVPFSFRVFNLSSTAHKRQLTLSASQPVGIQDAATQPLSIPANSFQDVTWNIDLSRSFEATGKLKITVRAANAAAQPLENVEIDLTCTPSIEQLRQHHPQRTALPICDLTAWRKNIVGSGQMTMETVAGKIWKLNAQFQGGDRWVYPNFALPEHVAVERSGAIVLRARCLKDASVRLFLWEGDSGVGYLSPILIPSDGKWHVGVADFEDFSLSGANAPDPNHQLDLNLVRRISIGMNSRADENTLEVSDVYLIEGE